MIPILSLSSLEEAGQERPVSVYPSVSAPSLRQQRGKHQTYLEGMLRFRLAQGQGSSCLGKAQQLAFHLDKH